MEYRFNGPKCDCWLLWYEYVFAVCRIFTYCDCDIYLDNGAVDWVWFVHYRKTTCVLIEYKKIDN